MAVRICVMHRERALAEAVTVMAIQFLRVSGDPSERCLEVVGHSVGEGLQLLVPRPQQLLDLSATTDFLFEFVILGAQLDGSGGDTLFEHLDRSLALADVGHRAHHADRLHRAVIDDDSRDRRCRRKSRRRGESGTRLTRLASPLSMTARSSAIDPVTIIRVNALGSPRGIWTDIGGGIVEQRRDALIPPEAVRR